MNKRLRMAAVVVALFASALAGETAPEANLTPLGTWSGGGKEHLAVREMRKDERGNYYTLLLMREGKIAASLPVGFELAGGDPMMMNFDETYMCDADLSQKDFVRLVNCRQQNSDARLPKLERTYRWKKGSLQEVPGKRS
jgi:hypothetical protein